MIQMISRGFLPGLIIFWSVFFLPAAGAQAPLPAGVDRIAAIVNSEAITEYELQQQVRMAERQLREQRIELPPTDILERQVLERMILNRAQLQLARDEGVQVDDQQLARAMEAIAAENGMDQTQLRARLERQGVEYDHFRREVREQLIRQRLREREVDSRVQISDADIDAWLDAHAGSGDAAGTELHVAQILLRLPESADAAEIERQQKRAAEIERQLQAGADFARLSAAFSDAPEAMNGGSLGWRTAERLPQLFVDAMRPLSPGGVSGVLRSPAGFHILQLIDRRSAGPLAAVSQATVQTHARHILLRPSEVLSEEEARRRLRELRRRIEAGTDDFAELARQYSSDGSAGRGGDLGWIYPGDTVPEFERAMDALAPGQLSDPVRTPFGLHLIQVIERRTDRTSPDRIRQQARQALREQRIDENYEDWLRQLRDRTYVEYKLDRFALADPHGEH